MADKVFNVAAAMLLSDDVDDLDKLDGYLKVRISLKCFQKLVFRKNFWAKMPKLRDSLWGMVRE